MILATLAAAALAQSAFGQTYHRIDLKPTAAASQGKALPYTLEVPEGYVARQVEGYPGLWIGPADAKAPEDPRLIWVRGSQVPLGEPEKVVANIKTNDQKDPSWSAPRVEVRDLGGVKGVLVETLTGEGDKARGTLTLKVPLASVSLDFIGSALKAEFPQRLPLYEHVLLSVRPAEVPGAAKQP